MRAKNVDLLVVGKNLLLGQPLIISIKSNSIFYIFRHILLIVYIQNQSIQITNIHIT